VRQESWDTRLKVELGIESSRAVRRCVDRRMSGDTALFLDIDLSILGTKEAEFDEYEAVIRKGYDFVDDRA
jgi:predicted metal-dependent HD superfamily phosphohydrolase